MSNNNFVVPKNFKIPTDEEIPKLKLINPTEIKGVPDFSKQYIFYTLIDEILEPVYLKKKFTGKYLSFTSRTIFNKFNSKYNKITYLYNGKNISDKILILSDEYDIPYTPKRLFRLIIECNNKYISENYNKKKLVGFYKYPFTLIKINNIKYVINLYSYRYKYFAKKFDNNNVLTLLYFHEFYNNFRNDKFKEILNIVLDITIKVTKFQSNNINEKTNKIIKYNENNLINRKKIIMIKCIRKKDCKNKINYDKPACFASTINSNSLSNNTFTFCNYMNISDNNFILVDEDNNIITDIIMLRNIKKRTLNIISNIENNFLNKSTTDIPSSDYFVQFMDEKKNNIYLNFTMNDVPVIINLYYYSYFDLIFEDIHYYYYDEKEKKIINKSKIITTGKFNIELLPNRKLAMVPLYAIKLFYKSNIFYNFIIYNYINIYLYIYI